MDDALRYAGRALSRQPDQRHNESHRIDFVQLLPVIVVQFPLRNRLHGKVPFHLAGGFQRIRTQRK